MNPHIDEIVSLLSGYAAPGSEHIIRTSMNEIHERVANAAQSRGYPGDMADAIFSYVANHHAFDLDSIDYARRIIDAVLELACPLATDDERSRALLMHLQTAVPKRLHRFS